jgi:hypothetical protein
MPLGAGNYKQNAMTVQEEALRLGPNTARNTLRYHSNNGQGVINGGKSSGEDEVFETAFHKVHK